MDSTLAEIKDAHILQGLLRLGKQLSVALTIDDLRHLINSSAGDLTGAANASVAVLEPDGESVQIFRGPNTLGGYDEIETVGLDAPTPLAAAIRSGNPEVAATGEEFARLHPRVIEILGELGPLAVISQPLRWEESVIGSIMFRFAHEQDLTDHAPFVIGEIAELVAQNVIRIEERETLAERGAELERSNSDLESYAAVVAHDLRGPLRRISSYVQLLMREIGEPTEKASGYAATIKDQAAYLDRLLNDVLHYSTAVTTAVPDTTVSIAGSIAGIKDVMAEELQSSGGSIVLDGYLPDVIGDAVLIRQLLANMISNAVRYQKEGVAPVVTISAQAAHSRGRVNFWRINVADNGIGLNPAFKDSVFDMFSRLDPGDGKDGTGVGLAFAKRVVERHKGEIGVESEPGVGSVFWFTLPGATQTWEFDAASE